MKTFIRSALLGLAALAALAAPALAQSVTLDQLPVPFTSTNGQSELLMQAITVPGGTVYDSVIRQGGLQGPIVGVDGTFVPFGATSPLRYMALTNGKSDLGVPMTAAAGTPAGTVGITRTAGTSMVLTGEATSASAKTDKVIFEFNLPDTYVAGTNIPVVVNANYTGGGTVTGASTTMTTQAFSESITGTETALTVTAAQQFTGTAANYTYTVTGTGLVPGQHVVLELVMLVTTSAGAATGQINSVAVQG